MSETAFLKIVDILALTNQIPPGIHIQIKQMALALAKITYTQMILIFLTFTCSSIARDETRSVGFFCNHSGPQSHGLFTVLSSLLRADEDDLFWLLAMQIFSGNIQIAKFQLLAIEGRRSPSPLILGTQ